MSPEDYIKLPNGRKIYLNKIIHKVDAENFRNYEPIFWRVLKDKNNDGFYNNTEIHNLFQIIQKHAKSDGDNELSEDEFDRFIKQASGQNKIHKKDRSIALNFLTDLQDEIEKSEAYSANERPDNTIHKLLPELDFLELGDDKNIDITKLSYNNLKRIFKDSSKYNIVEDKQTLTVKDKKTDRIILEYMPNNISIYSKNGDLALIQILQNEDLLIIKQDKQLNMLCGIDVKAGLVTNVTTYQKDKVITNIKYENGIISQKKDNSKKELTFYSNGDSYRIVNTENNTLIKNYEAEKLEKLIKNSTAPDVIRELIEFVIIEKREGELMDDYYQLTGHELIDDIQNSNLSDSEKAEFIDDLSYPFIDSKYFNSHLIIENSKIDNQYYTGDEYKISYNGPIVKVLNKNTGDTTRLNLKTLFQTFDMNAQSTKDNLKTLQNYSGEILENIGIEINRFRYKSEDEISADDNAAGFYNASKADVTISSLKNDWNKGEGTVIHEMGHGLDAYLDDRGFIKWKSESGHFKEVYDKCIKKYKDKYPMWNNENIDNTNKKASYFSQSSKEAFAICMSGILGKPDWNFKFVEKNYPELVVAAAELYRNIKKMPKSKRQQQNLK